MNNIFFYDTQYGKLAISDNGTEIIGIMIDETFDSIGMKLWETELIRKAYVQIMEYFEGKRKVFEFPIEFCGTEFQNSVWKSLMNIPYGETRSYKEVAETIGKQNAFRAVGNAVGNNPILLVIPCHRVIRSDGKQGGFSAGVGLKKVLIELERCNK